MRSLYFNEGVQANGLQVILAGTPNDQRQQRVFVQKCSVQGGNITPHQSTGK
jgi:hypothetical protein